MPLEIDGVRVHRKLTHAVITEAVERRLTSLDDPGFCISCGAAHDGIEPDAEKYECEACGALSVYGADELLLRMS